MITGEPLVIGTIGRPHGVRGWFAVNAHTREVSGILDYDRWLIEDPAGWLPRQREAGRRQGKGIIAKLAGVDTREQAEVLTNRRIAVDRSWLEPLPDGEFYWIELVGLEVSNTRGVRLGTVTSLFETGANDVLVIDGEKQRLLPYVPATVLEIDLEAGRMLVDWDQDF